MATDIFGNIANSTTLARSPFLSRFTEFESQDQNYAFIGFTPGLELQAAELNELQDNFHKVSTLNSILISNWTLYCIKKKASELENTTSFLWDGVVPIDPSLVSVANSIVTCARGWYYITDTSGIKYWGFLPTSSIISTISGTTGFINFTITNNDIFATDNNALYDNSAGIPNTNSPGAYRIKLDFSALQFSVATNQLSVLRKISGVFSWPNGITI